jgi:NAD(P)-dependent dehydrogenase (short-subunit alcohol dehydrogenase family)
MGSVSGRRVLITGVSRGLGRALAEGFVDHGQTVIGCARSEEAVDELRQRHGLPHDFRAVDVADDAQVADWARHVMNQSGPPEILVNNAGVINRSARLWEVPAEEFSAVVDVNLKGVFHVLRHFLPAMIEAGRGMVVNFSSGWGRSTSPEVAPYCATKWAIEGLTRALASELPRGLSAVALNPGVIHTEMLESCFGDAASQYPSPELWAERAVPYVLQLSTRDNGQPVSVPG